ncbi:MAG: hypothetical protein AMXMBFR78_25730 [Rubrivivax sp.]|jgi:type IV pilus assembly protein PilP|nr:pilus assembly protein PilP [Rubrivivax sp.]
MKRPTPTSFLAVLAGVVLLGALGACTGDLEELQQWTEVKRREVKPNVPKLEAPKKFEPEPYTEAQAVDPFSPQKLTVALRQEARQLNPLLASELNRRKEPLEAYPLDNMAMVGSFSRSGRPYALLRVDNLLYQVKVGDYLGQNYGRITQIGETELTLREVVQDAVGEWTERTSTLQLQEKAR